MLIATNHTWEQTRMTSEQTYHHLSISQTTYDWTTYAVYTTFHASLVTFWLHSVARVLHYNRGVVSLILTKGLGVAWIVNLEIKINIGNMIITYSIYMICILYCTVHAILHINCYSTTGTSCLVIYRKYI